MSRGRGLRDQSLLTLQGGGGGRMSLKGITWLSKGTEGGWQADKVSRGDYRKLTANKGGVGP